MVLSDPPNGAPLLHIPITINSTAVRLFVEGAQLYSTWRRNNHWIYYIIHF